MDCQQAHPGSDQRARFRHWVEPEIEVMLRVAHTLTGNKADAEDIVQDALIKAYAAVERFDGAHPRAWLLTILRRSHLNAVRKKVPLPVEQPEVFAPQSRQGSPEQLVMDSSMDGDLKRAFHTLKPAAQELVYLVDVHGLQYAEAAAVLDIPIGTVMSRLKRSRDKMRSQLSASPAFVQAVESMKS